MSNKEESIHPGYKDFDPITTTWFVVVDDLIGGYAISTVDYPLSSAIYSQRWPVYSEEDPLSLCFPVSVGCFVKQKDAEHIVQVHNDWLKRQ